VIGFLLATLMQATPTLPIAEDGVILRQPRKLEMPREIAPAIFPYFGCVMTAMNAQGGASTGEAFRAIQKRAIESCSSVRSEAKAAAMKLLSQSTVPHRSREAFVEKALLSIDHAQDDVAVRLDVTDLSSDKRN
jgi:hypothetical protein